ncbi:MAG: CdaR family protein [Thermaerobacterales bacterium]
MIERFLRRDNNVKILSLILALSLWLYVFLDQTPDVSRTIRELEILLENIPEGLAVVNVDPVHVSVMVRGNARLVNDLEREDFEAMLDLADAQAGQFARLVNLSVPDGVQQYEMMPPQVIVFLEAIRERYMPVELSVGGSPAENHLLGLPYRSPGEVRIRGADSLVDQVARVVTGVEINGATESVVFEDVRVYPIDVTGRQVSGVTVRPEVIRVTVPVEPLPPERSLTVEALLTGRPAEGFEVTNVRVRPQFVTARVPESLQGRVDPVQTGSVDLTGRNETFTVVVPIVLNERIISDQDLRAEVTVTIRPIPE